MSRGVTFGSGGRRLSGRVFPPSEPEKGGAGILFVHGSGSSQSGYRPRAEAAAERLGATCLTFDLSGHGASEGSTGDLSPRDHLADCRAAFDALAGLPDVEPDRIGVCGASYGAYLAALLIAERPVVSLLLRAPALYPDSELDRRSEARLSSDETVETAAALRNVAAYGGPVLVLESEKDKSIPPEIVAAYLSAARDARHETIPEAEHELREEPWRRAFVEAIVSWFGETLGVAV